MWPARRLRESGWCGDEDCEEPIKDAIAAEIVMVPLDRDEEPIHEDCAICGEDADETAYFAKLLNGPERSEGPKFSPTFCDERCERITSAPEEVQGRNETAYSPRARTVPSGASGIRRSGSGSRRPRARRVRAGPR